MLPSDASPVNVCICDIYSGTSLVRGSTFADSELRGSKKYSKIKNIKKYYIKIRNYIQGRTSKDRF